MASLFLIGDLTIKKARSFIESLMKESELSSILCLRIKSHGGNLRAYGEIANAMHELSKEGIRFVGQADEVGSAAMLIFLNCDERWGRSDSYGFIHLPEPNQRGVSGKEQKEVSRKIISFIQERTNLSAETILSLNNVPLFGKQMFEHGILTKEVTSFEMVTAETV